MAAKKTTKKAAAKKASTKKASTKKASTKKASTKKASTKKASTKKASTKTSTKTSTKASTKKASTKKTARPVLRAEPSAVRAALEEADRVARAAQPRRRAAGLDAVDEAIAVGDEPSYGPLGEKAKRFASVEALCAWLDALPLEQASNPVVSTLYNAALTLVPKPEAFFINERIARLPLRKNDPRRRVILLAINNALYAALASKDNALGLRLVERALRHGDELPSILHNVACVLARDGQHDAAAAALLQALAAGYENVLLLTGDEDLVHLMDRDDLRPLLARRHAALEAQAAARLEELAPHFGGRVPDDVALLWRMLIANDSRLKAQPNERRLTIAEASIVLHLPHERRSDAGVAVLDIDDVTVRYDLDDDVFAIGVRRNKSLPALLAGQYLVDNKRAFLLSLFREYGSGREPTPSQPV
jgi:hypothetical protein